MTKAIEPKTKEHDIWGDFDRQFETLRSRFFDEWGLTPFGPLATTTPDGQGGFLRLARTDISDAGTAYKIVTEIPGIPKENLDIRVRGTTVEIRGQATQETREKDGEYLHQERRYSGYYRALELPEPVQANEAKAKVENGLLELELPKLHPTPSPAEVKVKVA